MLFDVGCEGAVDFLVMELVEGGTLAERLQRGALSNAELMRFGGADSPTRGESGIVRQTAPRSASLNADHTLFTPSPGAGHR